MKKSEAIIARQKGKYNLTEPKDIPTDDILFCKCCCTIAMILTIEHVIFGYY